MDFHNSPKQFKKQLHLYSGNSQIKLANTTNRNRMTITLAEPISCKDNQYLAVRVQRVIYQRSTSWTWTDANGNGPMFLYLTSFALKSTNYNNNTVLASIPIIVPGNYTQDYENISNMETVISSKEITNIDISLVNPDFSDIINTACDMLVVLEFNAYDI